LQRSAKKLEVVERPHTAEAKITRGIPAKRIEDAALLTVTGLSTCCTLASSIRISLESKGKAGRGCKT
jgi:hypothetical protein